MKKLTVLIILNVFFHNLGSCQNTEKTVKRFWWNVKQGCFTGTSISKKNGMFVSTVNKIPVGSTYKVRKNLWGNVKGISLDFTHKSIIDKLPSFPSKVDSASTSQPCSFKLTNTQDYQVEIAAKLVDQTNIGKINTEIQTAMKKAVALELNIIKWGFEILEQGQIELCLSENKSNSFTNILRSGNRYITLTAIWIEGVDLKYELDKETVSKIEAIYEANKEEFIKAGVTFSFESLTNFSTKLKYYDRFYPFYRFGKITKEGEIKGIKDVIITEPDFIKFNEE